MQLQLQRLVPLRIPELDNVVLGVAAIWMSFSLCILSGGDSACPHDVHAIFVLMASSISFHNTARLLHSRLPAPSSSCLARWTGKNALQNESIELNHHSSAVPCMETMCQGFGEVIWWIENSSIAGHQGGIFLPPVLQAEKSNVLKVSCFNFGA